MHSAPHGAVNTARFRSTVPLVAMLALLGLGVACGGGKANPPPASERPGTGGRTSSGTGGKTSGGTGGTTSNTGGSSSGAGGSSAGGSSGTGGAASEADAAGDTGADAEPVDLGPPPPNCGNGTPDPGEDCDKGAANESNPYGKDKCTKNCKWAPYCGDGTENKTHGEACDKGAANGDKAYGAKGDCSATCKLIPHCGDKTVQDPPEKCDEGEDKAATAGKAGCKACQIVAALPTCGDGKKEGTEACDNGNANIEGDYAPKPAVAPAVVCNKQCKVVAKFCGDNKTDTGHEQCDRGPTGAPAMPGMPGCTAECKTVAVAAQCGDGVKNVVGEDCDHGAKNRPNDAPYVANDKPSPYIDPVTGKPALFCSKSCKDVHYCGDGSTQTQEECDLGQGNAANAYGENKCTDKCQKAPFCGDAKVASNEKCDNGATNLDPGTGYVGGVTDANKPPCRRGLCTVIPHCGDGVQSHDEKCDNGKSNVTSDYVGGTSPSGQKPPCKVTCALVPYCGDGVVSHAEPCDPETADAKLNKNCTSDCKRVEPSAKSLKVTRISGNVVGCTGSEVAKCLGDVNESGGASVGVACTAAGETELEFGGLGGRPQGDVALTLDGVPGAATVTCDAGGSRPAVSSREKLPEGCWANNRSIKVQIKSSGGACIGLSYAVVRANVLPN